MAEATLGRLNVIIGADDSELQKRKERAEKTLKQLDEKVVRPKMNAQDRDFVKKTDQAERKLRELDRKKATPKVDADIRQLQNKELETKRIFDRIERQAQLMQQRITAQFRAAFAGMFAGLAASNLINWFVQAASSAVPLTANLGNLAAQAALTVEQFQELEFAVRDAGIGQNAFARASETLARNLAELNTGTGQFRQFLSQSAPELLKQFEAVKDVNEAWRLLSDIMQRIPNEQDRVLFAQKALGSEGARLASVLARGSFELDRQRQYAHELGVVMDESAVAAADRANRKFDELSRTLSFKLKSAVISVVEWFERLGRIGSPESRLAGLNAAIEQLNEEIEKRRQRGQSTIIQEELLNEKLKERADLLGDILAKSTQVQKVQDVQLKPFDEASAEREFELRRQVAEMAAYYNSLLAEGRIIMESLEQPHERLAQQLERLSYLYRKGAIDAKTLGQAQIQANMAAASSYLSLAGQAAGAFSRIFQNNKAVAIAAAIINTAESVTKTLATYGATPWGLAAAATAAAAGAAQIATIRRTTSSGGGSAPRVGGGGGFSGGRTSSSSSTSPGAVLTIQTIGRGDFITREVFEDLMDRIVQWQRDGGTIAPAWS